MLQQHKPIRGEPEYVSSTDCHVCMYNRIDLVWLFLSSFDVFSRCQMPGYRDLNKCQIPAHLGFNSCQIPGGCPGGGWELLDLIIHNAYTIINIFLKIHRAQRTEVSFKLTPTVLGGAWTAGK